MRIYIFALILAVVLCKKGVDISVEVHDMSCFKKESMDLVIPRCFRSSGTPDPLCKHNLAAAKKAGINADIYSFPCYSCGNPAKQAEETIKAAAGEEYGRIWVDVEVYKWDPVKSKNRHFISEMVSAIEKAGKKVGIYTSAVNWESVVGSDWDAMSHLPVWYAHYDKNPSFSDFKPFGGWKVPTMKQYIGDTKLCSVGVDLNFFP